MIHRQGEVELFSKDYFGASDRRLLLIAGAGFDPRTLVVPRMLREIAGERLQLVLLREERLSPAPALLAMAERHIQILSSLVTDLKIHHVRVFADDMAVIIGRSVVNAVRQVCFDGLTDIVVDWSALSIGGALPLVRLLLSKTQQAAWRLNLHVMVVVSSPVDHAIERLPGGEAAIIHGYDGQLNVDSNSDAARLWVPQLRPAIGSQLDSIHRHLASIGRAPHDIMPVLPFPAQDPRLPDRLLEEFYHKLQEWGVSHPDLAYAAENDPLDLYRILVQLHDLRAEVFRSNRGSQVILSPLGSKLLAIGAMMAAIDRPMPVLYVEAPDFQAAPGALDSSRYTAKDIVHLWLAGEAYPPEPSSRGR